jgi:hypothetical protein
MTSNQRHFARAEAVGNILSNLPGYAGSTPKRQVDLQVGHHQVQVDFFGDHIPPTALIPRNTSIHVVGRLSQWGQPARQVGINLTTANHSCRPAANQSPYATWDLRGELDRVTQDPAGSGAFLARIIVIIPAGQGRDGRLWSERRHPYEVTVTDPEIARQLVLLPSGATVNMQGRIEGRPTTNGYGSRLRRNSLIAERLHTQYQPQPAAAAPATGKRPSAIAPPRPSNGRSPQQARRQ